VGAPQYVPTGVPSGWSKTTVQEVIVVVPPLVIVYLPYQPDNVVAKAQEERCGS
jgi:hypothetical protein